MSPNKVGFEPGLTHAWSLASLKPAEGDQLRLAVVDGAHREVSATITARGNRGILIPLRAGERVQIQRELRAGSSGALRAEKSQFSNKNEVVDALHVWCADKMCDDAFASFAAMLLERTETVELGDGLEACYHEFVKLIGKEDRLRITVTGLIGELIALHDLVAKKPSSVKYWGGPRGERHDFRNARAALEVKTSRRSEAKTHRVHIADWDQLEAPSDGKLFLHSIRLERVSGGVHSVSGLIASIKSKLGAAEMAAFDDALGNFDQSILTSLEEYAEISRDTFEVRGGFPRLVPSSIVRDENLKGVSSVQYDLDLQQATSFSVPWNAAIDAVLAGA